MDVNSEAIYGTRTLAPYKENNIGMTQKEDQAYFIYMDESGSGKMPEKIRIESHQPVAGAEVTLLGFDEPLNWKSSSEGFVANIPSEIRNNPPSEYAWVVKVSKIKE
jgi:alpha-L-fucosidase